MKYYQKFQNDFINWVEGIIEDDPLPYGINSVIFAVENDSNYLSIYMTASEENNVLKIKKDFYYPLEAQYFYTDLIKLTNFFKIYNKELLLNLMFSAINNNDKLLINNEFKNKNIFFGFDSFKPTLQIINYRKNIF